ncbi:MAG: hypothetical protein J3R72DRAFT_33018 [Linnemannia gamsii]|nr:MAG: hypothetical protein J3R72DRAFT_33018 [Linnemannia gamsii]
MSSFVVSVICFYSTAHVNSILVRVFVNYSGRPLRVCLLRWGVTRKVVLKGLSVNTKAAAAYAGREQINSQSKTQSPEYALER